MRTAPALSPEPWDAGPDEDRHCRHGARLEGIQQNEGGGGEAQRSENAAKKEYDERADAYKKALEEINQVNAQLDSPVLTADAKASKAKGRDEKIANLKNMEREISEFRQTREQQLQQQMLRMRENLLKEMTEVVLEQVKSRNMDLVFDKSGASFSPILSVLFPRGHGLHGRCPGGAAQAEAPHGCTTSAEASQAVKRPAPGPVQEDRCPRD